MKMRLYLSSVFACLAVSIGWVAGCGSDSAPKAPTAASAAQITGLTLKGNTTLTAPGQTSQLSAEAKLSDGSVKDVSSTANWSSSEHSVATISSRGLVTAVAYGKTTISVYSPGSPGASVVMTVLPDGTIILSGRVTEAGDQPLVAARVEIIGGPMSGRAAVTDQFGRYALIGVMDVAQVRATRDGYVAATLNVARGTDNLNIELAPTVPYAAVAGVYRLTFKAAESCQLPTDAVSRSYTATIAEIGARLTITLSDAQFSGSGNLIAGRVNGNTVSFMLNTDYYCLYSGSTCVAEKLADMRYLTLIGTAAGTVTGTTISTVFAGSVNILSTPNNSLKPIATCAAPDHQLIFTRTAETTARKRI